MLKSPKLQSKNLKPNIQIKVSVPESLQKNKKLEKVPESKTGSLESLHEATE